MNASRPRAIVHKCMLTDSALNTIHKFQTAYLDLQSKAFNVDRKVHSMGLMLSERPIRSTTSTIRKIVDRSRMAAQSAQKSSES